MIQPAVEPVEQPAASCKQTFNRLFNRFDNRLFYTRYNGFDKRLDVYLHDAAGYPTGCRLYNDGCIQPVVQPVGQPIVWCERDIIYRNR